MKDRKELSRKTILRHARNAALRVLEQYAIGGVRSVRLIRISDNITYRVETEQGVRYLLRLHRNERLGKPEITSEMVWLESLELAGIVAPKGIRNRDGSYVATIEGQGLSESLCTLMQWVEGRTKETVSEKEVWACGSLMAKLHMHAEHFTPGSDFIRPVWGAESLREDFASLGEYYRNFMSEEAYVTFQNVVEEVCAQIGLLREGRGNYGVIHSDLHLGNIVFHRGEPRPIDFGRCGYGYYLYDLAEALLGLISSQKKVFMEGYRSQRAIPTEDHRMLEGFFLVACIENTCFHAPVPEERENLIRQTPFVVKLMEKYLHGESFL